MPLRTGRSHVARKNPSLWRTEKFFAELRGPLEKAITAPNELTPTSDADSEKADPTSTPSPPPPAATPPGGSTLSDAQREAIDQLKNEKLQEWLEAVQNEADDRLAACSDDADDAEIDRLVQIGKQADGIRGFITAARIRFFLVQEPILAQVDAFIAAIENFLGKVDLDKSDSDAGRDVAYDAVNARWKEIVGLSIGKKQD
jgi:hypothetical protein